MSLETDQIFSLLRNIADIAIVTFIIYRVLLIIKGTRAAPMLGGLTVIVLLYFLAQPLGLVTLAWILGNFLSSIILVVVVIFQDDIRRGLTKVGLQPLFRRQGKTALDKTLEDITLVATNLSRDRIGALIVIQRDIGLDEFLEDGTIIDSLVNRKLLYSLFLKDSPLHDGAVVIDGDRIRAAGCVLPLSFNPDLDPNLGTRHRAALGLSERSDALIIVISEETGALSFVREGRIIRNLDGAQLRDTLHRFLTPSRLDMEEEAVDE
ncbi:MAG: TIGR00159 family protein [SAR324 cluster bacterium]|uniref:Diadenylate cyclase n=1 Tax=SAR324 cluster bacterium TaxID=2024889 RepID=A0A7X9FRD4_9DELT|nr:TIGR00159 family protein [SAR324 cluster bacterium]